MLESLIALGALVTIVALVLNQINRNHEHLVKRLHEQEVLMVATMAVQAKQSHLTLNGVSVDVTRTEAGLLVTENGKEVICLEKH